MQSSFSAHGSQSNCLMSPQWMYMSLGNHPSRCLALSIRQQGLLISIASFGSCPSTRSARIPPPAPANKCVVLIMVYLMFSICEFAQNTFFPLELLNHGTVCMSFTCVQKHSIFFTFIGRSPVTPFLNLKTPAGE